MAEVFKPGRENPSRGGEPGELHTMGERIVKGLGYPLRGLEIFTLLGIALLGILPGISLLMVPVVIVYVLAILRASASGKTKMPAWVETDNLPEVIGQALRAFLVTVVAFWPVLGWIGYWYLTTPDLFSPESVARLLPGVLGGALLSWLYYPACLAILAVWDSASNALNPAHIARVIRHVGTDYWIATAIGAVAIALAVAVGVHLGRALSDLPGGREFPKTVLSVWAQFYAAHLIGYAIFRHAKSLGWD